MLETDGFAVRSQTDEEGELDVVVETRADVVGCPRCGVRVAGHGRSVVQDRDLPAGGRPVRLVWPTRRWIWHEPDCDATSVAEQTPAIEGCLTARVLSETAARSCPSAVVTD